MPVKLTNRRQDKSLPLLNRVVQLRFDDKQYDRLKSMADGLGISVGQLVRQIVHHQLLDDPEVPTWLLEEDAGE